MTAEMDFPASFDLLGGALDMGSLSISPLNVNLENPECLSAGKPPRHLSSFDRGISSAQLNQLESEVAVLNIRTPSNEDSDFKPMFRSGSCSEIGPRTFMEDEYICIDDLSEYIITDTGTNLQLPGAFYGVFDGHGGTDAAVFAKDNILKFIVDDCHFPLCLKNAMTNAFLKADRVFADAESMDISSGTTALAAFMFGRTLLIANAGDCRAVLGKRGRAVELSKDHKPSCRSERIRIERLGGVVYDGYLNGQLSVSRALGDWHMKGLKGSDFCPLSPEPKLQETILTEEDEFLILGCDGLWDVMSSQHAVTIVRKELMIHNDPERCSRVLVREALKLDACDNLTVIVVCFSSEPPPRIEMRKSRFRKSISTEGLNLLQDLIVHQQRGE
ncbi:putative protein phosphatase 2C 27 [Drosera capensis]